MEGFRFNFGYLVFIGIFHATLGSMASDHPCNRDCVVDRPRTCEYNFTLENYFVLSKACYKCPFVRSDCFRPHCVSTNGFQRQILTVNRQMPGPSIQVCKGDHVRVWVENKIEDGSATSIHWHGLHQINTGFMDGVGSLTQCNIPPYELFRYEFIADNAGTHWYHSHTGVQLGDGLNGAFIVREPDSRDPSKSLYDEDASEHIIMISDWQNKPQMYRYMEEMHDRWRVPMPIKALINGRGQKYLVPDTHNITGYATVPEPMMTPYEVFNVTKDTRYRFRVISAATRCFFRVMIDSHLMTVIATDGSPLKPAVVGSFMIHPGERYDFVLNAVASPGDYWIKLQTFGECSPSGGHGAAVLHYSGYEGEPDMTPTGDVTNFTQSDVILNPTPTDKPLTNIKITQSEMRYAEGQNRVFDNETVDVLYYIDLKYLQNDNSLYSHPEYYTSTARLGIITPTLNNLTMYLPAVPLLTQWNDVHDKNLCNTDNVDTAVACNDNLCHCTHTLDVKLGQVVEIFVISHTNDPHPMHLHGYSFRVVGDGMLSNNTDEPDKFKQIFINDVIARDKTGAYPRILDNPMMKDTVTVHGKGSYTIIRFKADNPGLWFFHCHNEGHRMQGMAMMIKVGDPNDFPKPTGYFPTCGGYNYQQKQPECKVTSSGYSTKHPSAVITMFLMFLLFV